MKKKVLIFLTFILAATIFSSCGNNTKNSSIAKEEIVKVAEANNVDEQDNKTVIEEKQMMTINFSGKEYAVILNDNVTVQDIVKNMPLELNMVKYANHEYYDKLPFTPRLASEKTTLLKAGHLYYWNVWNSFVINYIDYDIKPYEVIHIGEITDKNINELLKNSGEKIIVSVRVD